MAIDSVGNNAATTAASTATNPNGILGKDDFMKLLLLELKYQDPTSPMDSEKILTQTSQLASLESAENTNKSLTALSTSLAASMQLSGISAIGKIADTGSNAVALTKGQSVDFQLYFPDNVTTGSINIMDVDGKVLRTMKVGATDAGVAKYTWDGKGDDGSALSEGTYYVDSSYAKTDGSTGTTRIGRYPIESIKFDAGKTFAKLGTSYVDFSSIKEIMGN
ncbi:MAG: flagellar hook capping FlgD N-terminal domain-containing protein [Sulfuricurvum sp.]|nr:flagellar hook capping FlgD N-terminal domain-containing protein [Sulfuricurvum sp.]